MERSKFVGQIGRIVLFTVGWAGVGYSAYLMSGTTVPQFLIALALGLLCGAVVVLSLSSRPRRETALDKVRSI